MLSDVPGATSLIILPASQFRHGPLQADHPSIVTFFQEPWVARLKRAMTLVWVVRGDKKKEALLSPFLRTD
jgi:hypothetical protein